MRVFFFVIGGRSRTVDYETAIKAVCALQLRVRVVPEAAALGGGQREDVGEGGAGLDWGLG